MGFKSSAAKGTEAAKEETVAKVSNPVSSSRNGNFIMINLPKLNLVIVQNRSAQKTERQNFLGGR